MDEWRGVGADGSEIREGERASCYGLRAKLVRGWISSWDRREGREREGEGEREREREGERGGESDVSWFNSEGSEGMEIELGQGGGEGEREGERATCYGCRAKVVRGWR